MATIKLYRDTNFQGESISFNADAPLTISNLKDSHFNDCTSSLVVSGQGTWILYQNVNCGGDQWPVTATGGVDGTGAYPNPSSWNGKNDSISSLQYVPNTSPK